MSRTEEQKAARRKAAQERRADIRQALIDEQEAHRKELEIEAARRRALPMPKILAFKNRGNTFSIDFSNAVTISFDPAKDRIEEVKPRALEQIRLIAEAEKSTPN